jgi:hypothetical protein
MKFLTLISAANPLDHGGGVGIRNLGWGTRIVALGLLAAQCFETGSPIPLSPELLRTCHLVEDDPTNEPATFSNDVHESAGQSGWYGSGWSNIGGPAMTQDEAQHDADQFDFTSLQNDVILQLDLKGGFRAAVPASFEREPTLRLRGDGTLLLGRQTPRATAMQGQLTPSEVQQVLRQIVDDLHFFKTTQEQLQQEQTGHRSMLADGLTTEITVRLVDQQQTLSAYALRQLARDLPDAEAVQRLARMETVLRDLKQLGEIGSSDDLNSVLAAANQRLELELPDAAKWTRQQIRKVERDPQGGLSITLSRTQTVERDGYNLKMIVQRKSKTSPWQIDLETW